MPAQEKSEIAPLLALGFHSMTVGALRELCVDAFPNSTTRSLIMRGLEEIIRRLNANGINMELWVDGSFVTRKLNPEDSDVVVCIPGVEFDAATSLQQHNLERLISSDLKPELLCDFYGFVEYKQGHALAAESEWRRAYWIRQFGFTRADTPKGLAVINIPASIS